ncbi:MAG: cytochrome c oxidase subunit II [Phycisphaerales bacterium]
MTIQTNTLAEGGLNQWLHDIWFKPGNSNLTADVDWMFMFILWVSIISFFMLMIPMCLWAIQYRRRPGVAQQRTPNHNLFLEITWVVVPLLILTYMFFKGFHGYMDAMVTPGRFEEVAVTGKMWNWSAVYDNGAGSPVTMRFSTTVGSDRVVTGNADFPIFVIPEGKPIRFKLKSDDVIHSFFIPDMRIKNDVMTNRYTAYTVTALSEQGPDGVERGAIVDKAAGTVLSMLDKTSLLEDKSDTVHRDHVVYCAEYCGTNHSEMAAVIRVVPQSDYAKIKAQWGNLDKVLMEDPVKLGAIVVKARGCASCHSIDGSASTGPTWKDAYGKPVEFDGAVKGLNFTDEFAKDKFLAWDNYIRESMLAPQDKIHKGYAAASKMPSFAGQISDAQIEGLIAYFRTLSSEWATTGRDAGADFKQKAIDADAAKKAKDAAEKK